MTDEIAIVMYDVMAYQEGNLRIPAVYCYVRERYLHMDRWLGALAATTTPVQLVWGSADPVAVVEMGRELTRRVPQAHYTELDGVGHFVPIDLYPRADRSGERDERWNLMANIEIEPDL